MKVTKLTKVKNFSSQKEYGISYADIQEFKQIIREENDIELSDEEAFEEAYALLQAIRIMGNSLIYKNSLSENANDM